MSPTLIAIDRLNAMQEERHAWLSIAAAQIRKWREEDEANGIEWESSTKRERRGQ